MCERRERRKIEEIWCHDIERTHLALNMLHWRGFANTALHVRGSFRGVKHFDHLQGCLDSQ